MDNVESFIGKPPAINSYCLVITKEGVTAVKLDPEFDYLRSVNSLRNKITSAINDAPLPPYHFEEERNGLYNALVKPALPHIPAGVRNVVIVPDGILAHLPFDLLRENRDSPDFGETWRLSLSPSVSVSILALKDGAGETAAGPREPLLAFGGAWYDKNRTAEDRASRKALTFDGDAGSAPFRGGGAVLRAEDAGAYYRERNFTWADLRGTEIEVNELAKLGFSQRPRIFLGREVSEERVKNLSGTGELRNYPILHFACHGYFNEPVPALSSIVFSEVSGLLGETGEDGYLTVPEIAVLDLDARMVTLSACETGLAQVRRGDGMVGLARSFLAAGAGKVGVSLWPISDDATVEFMARLYRKVVEGGLDFREAYYAVKGEFRDHLRWDHPYYWAAFTLYE
ncbi:MAG: CHAT domain-containing protein [Spirochaetaceae bacterium]|nr:CHAT domain-containing protein [Spirochaetaceae bacterium]